MIKSLSLQHLYDTFCDTIRKFPFEMLMTLVFLFSGISMIWLDIDGNTYLPKLFMLSFLGFFLFLNSKIAYLNYQISKRKDPMKVIISLILIGYFFILPDNIENMVAFDWITYVIITICAYLGVYTIPFINSKGNKDTWNFGLNLIFAQGTTILSIGTIFAGIATLLSSLNFLFDITIPGKIFPTIFISLACIAGIPLVLNMIGFQNLKTGYEKYNYGIFFKRFAQYVLMPLMGIYMIVLYIYGGKILLSGVWPNGEVSWLIALFSLLGMSSIKLLLPTLEIEGEKWIDKYIKAFAILLLPLLGLYFEAFWIRIQEYGLTFTRYYAILYGIIFIGISIYFILSNKRKLNHIVLCIIGVMILSLIGPISAYKFSYQSQIGVLKENLIKVGMLEGGKIKSASTGMQYEQYQKITGPINFIVENYGLDGIKSFLPDDLITKIQNEQKENDHYGNRWINSKITSYFNISTNMSDNKYFSFNNNSDGYIQIGGYEKMMKFSAYLYDESTISKDNKDGTKINFENNAIKIIKGTDETLIPLKELMSGLIEKYGNNSSNIAQDLMTISEGNTKIIITNISGKMDDGIKINSIDCYILLK